MDLESEIYPYRVEEIDLEKKRNRGEIYPITYNVDLERKNKHTSLRRNVIDTEHLEDFKIAPGIKIYQIMSDREYKELIEKLEFLFDNLIPAREKRKNVLSIRLCTPASLNTFKNLNETHYIECLNRKNRYDLDIFGPTFGLQNFSDALMKNYQEKNKEELGDISDRMTQIANFNRDAFGADVPYGSFYNAGNEDMTGGIMKIMTLGDDLTKIAKTIASIYIKASYRDILDKTGITLFKYQGRHNGLKLHIDDQYSFQGPVAIFNLGESILDFIPFEEILKVEDPEISKYRPFRIEFKPNTIILKDGDARFTYKHGIPKDISSDDTLRYAIVYRFPLYYGNKKALCKLDKIIKKSDDITTMDYRSKAMRYIDSGLKSGRIRNENLDRNDPFPCYSDSQQEVVFFNSLGERNYR